MRSRHKPVQRHLNCTTLWTDIVLDKRGGETCPSALLPPELEGLPYIHNIRKYAAEQASAGTWAEFGVANGNSARKFLSWMPDNTEIHLYDSFKGLPEKWIFNDDINHIGRFAVDEIPVFNDIRVHIHEGMFADTLPKMDIGVLSFVHIDCDIYSATKTVFDNIEVSRGTIILFDEYHGYRAYKDHERKAYFEWVDKGNEFEWLAVSRSQAMGIVK